MSNRLDNENRIYCGNCKVYYDASLPECPYCHVSTEENLNRAERDRRITTAERGGGFGEPGSTISRVAGAMVLVLLAISVAALLWAAVSLVTRPKEPVDVLPEASSSAEAEGSQGDASEEQQEAVEPTSVSLDVTSITLAEGEKYQLILTVLPNEWEGEVKWKSDNKKIASVDKKGKLTNHSGGDCTVTVTVGKLKATCAVHCEGMTLEEKAAEEQRQKEEEEERQRLEEERRREEEAAAAQNNAGGLTLTLNGKSYDGNDFTLVHVGEGYTFEITGGDGNYTASSSNSSVATVSGSSVTATGVGVATVTWKSADGKSVSATIRVNQP